MKIRFDIIFKLLILGVVFFVLTFKYQTFTTQRTILSKESYFKEVVTNAPLLATVLPSIKLQINASSGISLNFSDVLDINNLQNVSDGKTLESTYEKYMSKNEITCSVSRRIGNKAEGGWEACIASAFNFVQPCLVYSFGINNEWSFDDDVSNSFKCTIRAFDPSMKQLNHKRGTNILFFNEGLAGSDKVTSDTLWRLNTLRTLKKLFNETEKTIDYLKIDIEYWEWEALDQAILDGSLSKVKQIGLEVHRHEIYSKTSSVDNYKLYFRIFSKLRDLGFYRWNSHLNPQSYTAISTYSGQKIMCCHEIIFINVNYLP